MYKPINIRSQAPNEVKTYTISKFSGVDFTRGDYITDMRRSPNALNTIWGTNPNVFDTRPGIKRIFENKLKDSNNNGLTIYGIHIYEPNNSIIIHAGDKLFLYNGGEDELKAGTGTLNDLAVVLGKAPTTSFMFEKSLYILGAGKYLVYDGAIAKSVEEVAFVPTTVIGRLPNGGGTPFEAVNLLSAWRKNSFRAATIPQDFTDTFSGDGTNKVFELSQKHNVTYDEVEVKVENDIQQPVLDYSVDRINGKVVFLVAPINGTNNVTITYYAEDMNNRVWENEYYLDSKIDDGSVVTVVVDRVEKDLGTDYTIVNKKINDEDEEEVTVVVFDNGKEPNGEGVDNVVITFKHTVSGYADQINKCTIYGIFGGANDTRVFLSGNSDSPNKDWHSGLYDPTYFPDTGYTYIGVDNTAIMGYVKQYDTQMIIKEGNQQDGSAFLRTFALDGGNKEVFPLEQGAVGIGAISKRTFAYLQGEPLFLSSQGLIGVSGSNVDNQRLMRDKSTLINSVLTNEKGLENAIGVEYENKYYLFINGKVFVADYRVRYNDEFENIQYEWMYWATIRATAVKTHTYSNNTYLLFGYDGMVFRLKKNDDTKLYVDESSDGEELNVESYWTTPKMYLGSIAVSKTLRDIYILFSRKDRIDVNIKVDIDGNREIDLGNYIRSGVLDFSKLDIADFSFYTSYTTYTHKIRAMVNKFDNIQLKITNRTDADTIRNIGLGVELLQISYQLKNN